MVSPSVELSRLHAGAPHHGNYGFTPELSMADAVLRMLAKRARGG